MAQLFSLRANVHSRVIIVGVVVLVGGAGWSTPTNLLVAPVTGEELSQDCNLSSEPAAKLNASGLRLRRPM